VCDLSRSAESVQDVAFLAEQFGQSQRLEPGSQKMSRHQPRQALHVPTNSAHQKEQKMVAESGVDSRLTAEVAAIYAWLDREIRRNADIAGVCEACGRCCDFEMSDHHLFVTTPELRYVAANLGAENMKPMPTGRCPYNVEGKCSIYQYRFAGCRIFCCKGDKDFQSILSESVLKKLKTLCTTFHVAYRYTDLASALNSVARA